MQKYSLYTSKKETIGQDGEVNLRLHVNREIAPQRLSDFNGGTAEIYDGYSTYTSKFTIELTSYDHRRILLTNSDDRSIEIYPEFVRRMDPKDPLNQLDEIPLKLRQDLSGYIVINSSWGLK